MSAQPQQQVPLVQFAQKATAIVKAAGFDPKTIDLETFRRLAPLIFTRAYSAIYKEQLISELGDKSTKEEQILNSQLVIDGLTVKTRNPALATISGIDIFQGNHRAVGILAGVLFSEGQRLWMEKMKSSNSRPASAAAATTANPTTTNNPRYDSPVKSERGKEELFDQMNEKEKLENIRANPNVSPHELERLLNRITYLETRLRKKKVPSKSSPDGRRPISASPSSRPSHASSTNKARSNSRPVSAPGHRRPHPHHHSNHANHKKDNNNVIEDQDDDVREDNEGDDSEDEEDAIAIIPRNNRNHHSHHHNADDDNEEEEENTSDISNDLDNPHKRIKPHKKRIRPASAPTTRRVKSVSSRLYSAPLNKAAIEQNHPNTVAGSSPPKQRPPGGGVMINSLFTYDIESGRRILVSTAEHIKEERERKKKAMIITPDEDDLMAGPNANGGNGGYQAPQYPCKRIENSVTDWLKKMEIYRQENSSFTSHGNKHSKNNGHRSKAVASNLPPARNFQIYQLMEKFDLLISIEHCHNCQHHNVTTRHNPEEYIKLADDCLRNLTEKCLSLGLCLRVGVARVPAEMVTHKSKLSDVDSRVGAFEVQIACRIPNGQVITEVLHSKLQSRRWPSKSVLDKRLQSFALKTHATTYYQPSADAYMTPDYIMETSSGQNYPIGRFSFTDTVIADPLWSFPTSQPVCYVYDTRVLADQPKFTIGSQVLVKNMKYHIKAEKNVKEEYCTEKHPMLCIVQENLPIDSEHPNSKRKLFVKLKYEDEDECESHAHDGVVQVLETDCYGPSQEELLGPSTKSKKKLLPFEFETALLLFYREKLVPWYAQQQAQQQAQSQSQEAEGEETEKQEVYLSFPSFFHQLRKMTWQLVHKLKNATLSHPILPSRTADVHICYREYVLHQVRELLALPEEKSGFTVSELESLLPAEFLEKVKLTHVESHQKEVAVPPHPVVASVVDTPVASTSEQEEKKLLILTAPPQPKPRRRLTLTTRPSIQLMHDLHPAILENIKPAKDTDLTPIEALIQAALAAANSDSTNEQVSRDITVEQLMLPLFDFNLGAIAENSNGLRAMTAYLAPVDGDTTGQGNVISIDKLKDWLTGELVFPPFDQQAGEDMHGEVIIMSPLTATTTGNNSPTTPGGGVKGLSHSGISPGSKALLQISIGNTSGSGGAFGHLNPLLHRSPSQRSSKMDPITEDEAEASHHQQQKAAAATEEKTASAAAVAVTTTESAAVASAASETAVDEVTSKAITVISPSNTTASLQSEFHYDSRDIVINSIVLEGAVLTHSAYDSVIVAIEFTPELRFEANVCLAREKGSKKRSYTTKDWGDLCLSSMQFGRDDYVHLALLVNADSVPAANKAQVLTKENTQQNVSPNTVDVAIRQFYKDSYEIVTMVKLPTCLNSDELGDVKVIIYGTAREAKEARVSRIMSMKPMDLLSLKFEPLTVDDDYADDDDEHEDSQRLKASKNSMSKDSISQSLFPKPSYDNLMAAAGDMNQKNQKKKEN